MTAQELFDAIDRAIAAAPQDVAKVAAALDARLVRRPEDDSPAGQAYGLPATVKSGPWSEVMLRVPDALIGTAGVFLSVMPRAAEGVDQAGIVARFGADFRTEVPPPRYPAGSVPLYFIWDKPWGSLSIGVTADDAARFVRFIVKTRPAVQA